MSGGTTSLRQASAAEGMVLVPGGPFAMGSDKHHRETAPVHRVTIRILWKVLKGARISARRMTAAAISRRRHLSPPIHQPVTSHCDVPSASAATPKKHYKHCDREDTLWKGLRHEEE